MSALFDRRPAVDASVGASATSAVAAGRDIGQAITGPGAVGMHVENATLLSPDACPPAADVACPTGLFHLPTRAADFMEREKEAVSLWSYEVALVPGLLQTKGYRVPSSTTASRPWTRRRWRSGSRPAWSDRPSSPNGSRRWG
ncbi:Scr1 family TA system antitoxin-like transcriptional regulator [Streptomyces sp. NPDC002092]